MENNLIFYIIMYNQIYTIYLIKTYVVICCKIMKEIILELQLISY